MPEKILLVVARYSEDVSWLKETGFVSKVYDKNPDPLPFATPLPNIGREGHTYLTYILEHYESLPEYVVFLQGDPFDHMDAPATAASLKDAVLAAVEKGVPFAGLCRFRIKCDGLGRPHHLHEPESKGRWAGYGRDIPVAQTFAALFNAEPPQNFLCRGATGNMIVSRDRILTRPKAFYEFALALFESDPHDENNTGHAFERLWHLIFNGNSAWNREDYR